MPISSQSEEIPSDRFVPSARGPGFVQTTWLTRRLLLEGDLAIYSDHARLQTNSRYHLATARNLSDLFDLRGTTGVSLAIISDSLGADALGLDAQTIRLEWSLARRLMLGKPQFMLEDFLYDEALEHKFVKSSLLVTIERICHPSAKLRT